MAWSQADIDSYISIRQFTQQNWTYYRTPSDWLFFRKWTWLSSHPDMPVTNRICSMYIIHQHENKIVTLVAVLHCDSKVKINFGETLVYVKSFWVPKLVLLKNKRIQTCYQEDHMFQNRLSKGKDSSCLDTQQILTVDRLWEKLLLVDFMVASKSDFGRYKRESKHVYRSVDKHRKEVGYTPCI